MKRRILAVAAVAALPLGAAGCIEPPPPQPAESTVDAFYADLPVDNDTMSIKTLDSFGQTRFVAQTFTAGRSGTLDKVSAILGPPDCCGSLVPVTITVQTVDGTGRPSGTVIGEGVWNGPELPDHNTFADIPLTQTAQVEAGQKYALVFTNPAPTNMTVYLDFPGYPDGEFFEAFASGGVIPTSWYNYDAYYEMPFKVWIR